MTDWNSLKKKTVTEKKYYKHGIGRKGKWLKRFRKSGSTITDRMTGKRFRITSTTNKSYRLKKIS